MEPRLTIADETERLNAKLLGDDKTLNLQKMVLEEEKADAIWAKLKAEEYLKALKAEMETLEKEKGAEIDRLRRREEGLLAEVEKFHGSAAEEKVRADLAAASVADLQKQCEDLAEDAKGAVAATEGALKAQLAILIPDFDTDQISFFKDIMDGKVLMNDNHYEVDNNHQRFEDSLESKQQQRRENDVHKIEDFLESKT
ncbi:hypothetical protein PIB30_044982 [Stylosanthes scabra]|uniref:Uncharacterized protein n=1 Tax=Stylosanthes scabra TaxID=79078 RepID=A0ABU6VDX5_9FABA|nr:hypothetical protein [Stylosanthes scabra]